MKLKPAAEPIMIFGGSPIRVAVPPIFEQMISVIKKGTGLRSSFLQAAKVMGITRITVVTLSRKALANAVKKASENKTSLGLPFVCFKISFAIQVNMPDFAAM